MGLIKDIFGRAPAPKESELNGYFKTLTAYSPKFTTYNGGLYEMEQTRAAIHAVASACSKLNFEVTGAEAERYKYILKYKPNAWHDPTKFLYRLATCLLINNTAFIVPIYDPRDRKTITGFFPVLPNTATVKEYAGEPWLEYHFPVGEKAVCRLSSVGVLTRMQYKDDLFGENNNALLPTVSLLHTTNESIENGVKQSATIRFMAKLAMALKAPDIKAERKRFVDDNLAADNNSGVMMFDGKYSDVKQIESRPFVVDAEQMKLINENVYSYFGVNREILQNNWASSLTYTAFYEGAIEPFAIQLSAVLNNMLFNERQIAFGNSITLTANRLQYATNAEKLSIATAMVDRGLMCKDDAREIFNLPPIEDGSGKAYVIRGEYENPDANANKKGKDVIKETEQEGAKVDNMTNAETK